MKMQPVSIVTALITISATWYFTALYRSYQDARKMGFPVVLTPVNQSATLWRIVSVPLRPLFKRLLPAELYFRLEISTHGFESRVRDKLHRRYGPSFTIVGPGDCQFWTTDPALTKTITTRWRQYPRDKMAAEIMNLFGANVLTSEGEAWQRQRRVIAPIINERISKSVWDESVEQASEMAASYAHSSDKEVGGQTDDTIEGLRRIAINVLAAVAYGKPRSWGAKADPVPDGHELSYMETVFAIISNLVPAVLIPRRLLLLPIWPKAVQRIGKAVEEFPKHTEEAVMEARCRSDVVSTNLLSTIIRLSDQEKRDGSKSGSKLFLSESEICGNLFIFGVAGFDTTANTMAFAIAQLCVQPELQDWIIEELDQVVSDKDTQVYEEVFPKLKRLLALMVCSRAHPDPRHNADSLTV